MRRAILAVTLGSVMLTGAACDSDADNGTTAAAPTASPTAAATSASPEPDYSANTKLVCGKLQKVFDTGIAAFGTQVGKMIAYKEAKQAPEAEAAEKAAAQQLKTIGAKVKTETSAALDPELREAGAASAAKFTKSASDTRFFDSIKTTTDLSKTITARMSEWLSPVAGYCA